jgi:hypothetical protein
MAARLMTAAANEGVLVDEQTYLDSREQASSSAGSDGSGSGSGEADGSSSRPTYYLLPTT